MVTYPSVNGRWKDILTRKENKHYDKKNIFICMAFQVGKKIGGIRHP